jgi:hypothetical protein
MTFFYFSPSIEEFVPLKLATSIETALADDDQSEGEASADSTSSSGSESESESQQLRKDPKEPQAGGSQDPAQYQFAMLRKTVHVISCWNPPAQGSAATRMACGRQLVTSALQMLTHAEIAQSPGTLCNHPGCRQIWSNFDA